ncbi:transglutaminase-like cysteine peptidase [Devosia sp. PTR5]|uniref:Transglutaminase-like cysteine peptidase n=1 Tax=Devosia oryzisoli TaxID=2774138 RepID=A0A927FS15_9HYPH|nr:transglutaminase-like cysteine peptidase [Devosia oryzisoli]MBD8064377.1 transglutaminase-like cysteine peptidase [Devosia oryzisoli]
MATTSKTGLIAALLVAIVAFATPAAALDLTNVAFIQTSSHTTSIPVGALQFCQSHQGECSPNKTIVPATVLTEQNWQQLVEVNAYYNQTVVPATDEQLYRVEEFWTYPNGYGDCEDFALAKRRDLIAAGWAPSTLMIAVVRQPNGDGHAVLIARTDRGDMVLDNQAGTINLWSDTPYHYIKRQSQANPAEWVDMIDDRVLMVAANN